MRKTSFEEESRKVLEVVRRRYGFEIPDKILKKRRLFDDPELDTLWKVSIHLGGIGRSKSRDR